MRFPNHIFIFKSASTQVSMKLIQRFELDKLQQLKIRCHF